MKKSKTTAADRRLAPVPGSRPIVQCACCSGTGKTPLTEDLWRTLQKLNPHPTMTSDLVERGITRNAINNRLVQLEKLGLAKRCGKLGKWHLWRAVNADYPEHLSGY